MNIWVVLQLRDGGIHPMARETLVAGQKMSSESGGSVSGVVLGHGVDAVGRELANAAELTAVKVIDHPSLSSYTPGAFVGALAQAIRAQTPDLVLFPHSYQSVDYVPRLAQELNAPVVPEAVSFQHHLEENGPTSQWLFRRPVYAGKLQCDTRVKPQPPGTPILVSIQSGAFSASDLTPGSAEVESVSLETEILADREILGVEQAASDQVDLSQAEAIVAVGRGIGSADNMKVIEELAAELGAEVGASRPVIDSDWLPRDRQIGSSGQTVAPKVYVAVGISGAIQHVVGMKGSQTVVAINKDKNAPIFTISDYGIVGDLLEVVPALTAAIREIKAG